MDSKNGATLLVVVEAVSDTADEVSDMTEKVFGMLFLHPYLDRMSLRRMHPVMLSISIMNDGLSRRGDGVEVFRKGPESFVEEPHAKPVVGSGFPKQGRVPGPQLIESKRFR